MTACTTAWACCTSNIRSVPKTRDGVCKGAEPSFPRTRKLLAAQRSRAELAWFRRLYQTLPAQRHHQNRALDQSRPELPQRPRHKGRMQDTAVPREGLADQKPGLDPLPPHHRSTPPGAALLGADLPTLADLAAGTVVCLAVLLIWIVIALLAPQCLMVSDTPARRADSPDHEADVVVEPLPWGKSCPDGRHPLCTPICR